MKHRGLINSNSQVIQKALIVLFDTLALPTPVSEISESTHPPTSDPLTQSIKPLAELVKYLDDSLGRVLQYSLLLEYLLRSITVDAKSKGLDKLLKMHSDKFSKPRHLNQAQELRNAIGASRYVARCDVLAAQHILYQAVREILPLCPKPAQEMALGCARLEELPPALDTGWVFEVEEERISRPARIVFFLLGVLGMTASLVYVWSISYNIISYILWVVMLYNCIMILLSSFDVFERPKIHAVSTYDSLHPRPRSSGLEASWIVGPIALVSLAAVFGLFLIDIKHGLWFWLSVPALLLIAAASGILSTATVLDPPNPASRKSAADRSVTPDTKSK